MKNTLKVIVALLVFIVGIIVVDKLFVKEDKKESEKEIKMIDFQLSFLTSRVISDYEFIELNEEEKINISKYISEINYKEEFVELSFLGDYKLTFEDKVLIFDDNNDMYGLIKADGKNSIVNIKELKEYILKLIDEKNLTMVFLYNRNHPATLEFKRKNLSDEDKNVIKELFGKIRKLEEHEYVNLAISGNYYLIVDREVVYFDDLDGYAMKSGEMVLLDSELINVLKKYIVIFDDEECCSCCPDLKPEEVCIDACCSCN